MEVVTDLWQMPPKEDPEAVFQSNLSQLWDLAGFDMSTLSS